jgi:sugar lactone lactonase YvrE
MAALLIIGLGVGIANGQAIYTTTGNANVLKFDSSGNPTVIATPATIPWQSTPWGLACDNMGSLYVSALHSNRIYKFDASGNQSLFASGVPSPSGLTCDNSGNLYVVEQVGTILKFNSSGSSSVFASGLTLPNWLAFDGNGNAFVTTHVMSGGRVVGSAIEEIDSSGHQSLFASTSSTASFWGLAFDSRGNLYTATYTDGTILKFDSSGHQSIFASGLNVPDGLGFDGSGNLYVSIASAGTIEKFDSNGTGSIFASGLNFPLCIAVAVVPEPSSWAMLGLGAAALLVYRRRK